MSILKHLFGWISFWICHLAKIMEIQAQKHAWKQFPNVDRTAVLGSKVVYHGPKNALTIGAKTYINEAIIVAGNESTIRIGDNCALGYRVSIKAVTHDLRKPTPTQSGSFMIREKDISIGDNCWIGDNVFIKEGVTIGDNVIVGANSVVTKSFPSNLIIAGVPAKVLRPTLPDPN